MNTIQIMQEARREYMRCNKIPPTKIILSPFAEYLILQDLYEYGQRFIITLEGGNLSGFKVEINKSDPWKFWLFVLIGFSMYSFFFLHLV